MEVEIEYTNHRGIRAKRLIRPEGIRFGSNVWHRSSQWLLKAYVYDRQAMREFAVNKIHRIGGVKVKRLRDIQEYIVGEENLETQK